MRSWPPYPHLKVFLIGQVFIILSVWFVFTTFAGTSGSPEASGASGVAGASGVSGVPPVHIEAPLPPPRDGFLQVDHPLGPLFVLHPPLPESLRGHTWEALTPENVEDRSFLILLGSLINVSAYPKRILYDLGLHQYESSLRWMLDNYPAHFDEVYGFECDKTIFEDKKDPRIPEGGAHFFIGKYVGTTDDEKFIDFSRLLRETCRKEDFCVIKMDIEGAEWSLLPAMEEQGVHSLVDELFVELHFQDPHMTRFGWGESGPHSVEDARGVLNHWRHDLNVFTNPWP